MQRIIIFIDATNFGLSMINNLNRNIDYVRLLNWLVVTNSISDDVEVKRVMYYCGLPLNDSRERVLSFINTFV